MASRYWVGGTGNWDGSDTSHWSATSGGTTGASVPTSTDDVFMDANSGTGTITITGTTATALSITFNRAGLTLLHNAGSTVAAAGVFTFTAGTINTNGQTCSWGSFASSGTGTRVLSLGASVITINGTAVAPWSLSGTGVTLNAGTSSITTTYGFPNNNLGGYTYYNFTMSGLSSGSVTGTLSGGATLNNLTFTNGATKSLININSGTYTINGTLTITGTSTVNRIAIASATAGTTVSLVAAAVSLTNVDFQDITASGAAAPFTGTSLGDCLGNSGITFDVATTQTWQSTGGGAWSDVTKWTSRVPLAQDNVIINASFLAGQNITADMRHLGKNIDFTGVTGTPQLTLGSYVKIFGSITFSSNMNSVVFSNSLPFTLAGRGNHTITCAGRMVSGGNGTGFYITAPGGTYTAQDDLTMSTSFLITAGTFNSNNFNVSAYSFFTSGNLAKTINMGSGTWSVNGANSPSWSISGSNTTINANTSTIVIAGTSTSTRLFTGGGFTYNVLTYTIAGSTGTLQMQGSNTFNTINFSDATNARTLQLTSGTTTTITGSFNVNGTAGKLMTINSTNGGSAATLMKSSGSVNCNYLSIQDSTASGGAAWYAGSNSTNVSGNTGWIFSTPQNGWFEIL